MPIEIRELRIKTDVVSREMENGNKLNSPEIKALKRQVVNECKRSLKDGKSKNLFNR